MKPSINDKATVSTDDATQPSVLDKKLVKQRRATSVRYVTTR